MAESSMPPERDVIPRALPDLLDDTDIDSSPELPIKEEMIMAVMQELYNEINNTTSSSSSPPPPPPPEGFFTLTEGGEAEEVDESVGTAVTTDSAEVEEWVSELLEGRNGAELRDEWLTMWVPQQS